MAFPTKLLNQGEEIVLDLRPHWWRIVPSSVALGVAVIAGIWALSYNGTGDQAFQIVFGLLVLVTLANFVQAYIKWVSENFVVTNDRVIYRSGVVSKSGIEIPLDRINTVFFNQSLFERVLGAGDLGVESAGEGGQQTFESVRKPNLVQQAIYRAMEAGEQRNYERQAEATASAMGAAQQSRAPQSIPEQIESLDALRKQGALSEEEFEAKKRDLLDRM